MIIELIRLFISGLGHVPTYGSKITAEVSLNRADDIISRVRDNVDTGTVTMALKKRDLCSAVGGEVGLWRIMMIRFLQKKIQ